VPYLGWQTLMRLDWLIWKEDAVKDTRVDVKAKKGRFYQATKHEASP